MNNLIKFDRFEDFRETLLKCNNEFSVLILVPFNISNEIKNMLTGYFTKKAKSYLKAQFLYYNIDENETHKVLSMFDDNEKTMKNYPKMIHVFNGTSIISTTCKIDNIKILDAIFNNFGDVLKQCEFLN